MGERLKLSRLKRTGSAFVPSVFNSSLNSELLSRFPMAKFTVRLATIGMLAIVWSSQLSFVGQKGSLGRFLTRSPGKVRLNAMPVAAPTIERNSLNPGMPSSPDPRRLNDAVRWLYDEEDMLEKPPQWHVLLLDKTFEEKRNTVYRVTATLMSVLPFTLAEAQFKVEHARENLFSVLDSTDWDHALRTAQSLKHKGLSVRVVPGLPKENDEVNRIRDEEKRPSWVQ